MGQWPGFELHGAASLTLGDWDSFQASACSRPPSPTTTICVREAGPPPSKQVSQQAMSTMHGLRDQRWRAAK